MAHVMPAAWMVEAELGAFVPSSPSFVCIVPHLLLELKSMELPMRNEGIVLDQNGFRRDRMMLILSGIRNGDPIPPISVEACNGVKRYRLRDGFHRFYASVACGFSHIPVEIVPGY
jgi:hypothetical protein